MAPCIGLREAALHTLVLICLVHTRDDLQVNFAAQTEFECLANYRLLQKAHNEMTRTKVTTLHADVNSLYCLEGLLTCIPLQLLDWWKIVSDDERAWDLLLAMCKAIKGILCCMCTAVSSQVYVA